MLQTPMDVLRQFHVRKSKKQKQAFRDAVCAYAQGLGYSVCVEKGVLGSINVVIGNPDSAQYLVTAHYDTCARLPFPNWITPCNLPILLLYQLFLSVLLIAPAVFIGVTITWMTQRLWIVCLFGYLLLIAVLVLMVAGPANPRNDNDNTSGVVALLEVLRTMPESQRRKVCFVLFDLEEAGMIGASSYRKQHKCATDKQLVLNLDCVGDGDYLKMFPTKSLRKNQKILTSLYPFSGYFGSKSLLVVEKGRFLYPSDQMVFPYGVGICALNKCKFGLYLGKIHTPKDRVLDHTNINILRAALTSFICCDAVNEKGRNENETVR